jgi:hypothetical protein
MEATTEEDDLDLVASRLVASPVRPEPRVIVPISTMAASAIVYQAANALREKLEAAFSSGAFDTVEKRRNYLVKGLDCYYEFLKDLNLERLGNEFDELRSALRDANCGIKHQLLMPSDCERGSGHRDASQIWRARANLVLAIDARRALNSLDPTASKTIYVAAENDTWGSIDIAADEILRKDKYQLVFRIASKVAYG